AVRRAARISATSSRTAPSRPVSATASTRSRSSSTPSTSKRTPPPFPSPEFPAETRDGPGGPSRAASATARLCVAEPVPDVQGLPQTGAEAGKQQEGADRGGDTDPEVAPVESALDDADRLVASGLRRVTRVGRAPVERSKRGLLSRKPRIPRVGRASVEHDAGRPSERYVPVVPAV